MNTILAITQQMALLQNYLESTADELTNFTNKYQCKYIC